MPALPTNPSLKHLKNEAKQLLRALQDGSVDAAARVSGNLPRVSDASTPDVLTADVTLQEVQHVLAKEYGYRTWSNSATPWALRRLPVSRVSCG